MQIKNLKDLIEGEIYKHLFRDSEYIFVYRKHNHPDGVGYKAGFIYTDFEDEESSYDWSEGWNGFSNAPVYIATPQESAHLKACLEAGKYVETPKLPQEITFSIF